MKKLLVITTALVGIASATSASAADMAARPYTKAPPMVAQILSWSGLYAGIQGGGGWGTSKETFLGRFNAPGFLGTQNYNTNGGFVGGVVGYNWQVDNVVFGLEGDYHWADINGRSAVVNAGVGDTFFTKLTSFGDIKGRLGYAAGPALFFVSGGAAVGQLQHRYDGVPGNVFSQNTTRWGYTVGAGAEYMFAPNWSAKLEYNYLDFGKSTIQYSAAALNRSEWKDTVHTVKAGLSYHFGGPVIAKY
ncbi:MULTISPECIES: outer membrane protein [unclassified Bradyrhizobium]|uniref:outer membrane protein n=1 Tax=Bradyrhizobium TaxID=374 RepID=UPI0028E23693|nr:MULTISPECIES: outer membrane beta-barrel protein [unclassified Bradyrhizobium]